MMVSTGQLDATPGDLKFVTTAVAFPHMCPGMLVLLSSCPQEPLSIKSCSEQFHVSV